MALLSTLGARLSTVLRNPRQLLRSALIIAAYLCAFTVLDFLARAFEELPGVVGWYPAAGLGFALLLVFGARFAPALAIASLISSFFVYRLSQPPAMLLLWAFLVSLTYAAAAAFLRHLIRFDWHLRRLRDVTYLVFAAVLASLLLAVLSVSGSAWGGTVTRSGAFRAIFNWWIGETVGVLTITPFLLVYVLPWLKRVAKRQSIMLPARRPLPRPALSAIGQATCTVLVLYWVFGAPVPSEFRPPFLIILPLIWIALQHGFKRVVAAIMALNAGVMVAIWLVGFDFAGLYELELLMIGNCVVGLTMGAVVTERRQAGEILRASEDRYQALVDLNPDAILVTAGGKCVFANPTAARLFGADSPREVVGRNAADLIHPDDRELVGERTAQVLAGTMATSQEIKYVRLDGSPVQVEATVARIEFNGSAAIQVVARDITERKQAEEALRQTEEQLRQSQKMEALGQLAGGIAHDFNNLLTAIIGYSELILATGASSLDEVRPDIEEIKLAGERASALIKQILAFSRRQALQPTVVSLNDVLAGMEPLLRRTLGENIDLVTTLRPDLGRAKADVHQFEQVLMNLAVNARDAMPQGGHLTLETSNVELGKDYCRTHLEAVPGSYVMLAVSDTGIGMNETTREHIFEPFFTTKGPGEGTGLGLATVYGIVKQSGGSVFVYSESGKGTTFKVYLPRVDGPIKSQPSAAARSGLMGGQETILVVEDEYGVRELVVRILKGLGYDVIDTANGDDALGILKDRECSVDMLLTDVVLPGTMQGNELAQAVGLLYARLPVLYMSGYPREAIVHAGWLDEGVRYLEKPFTPDTLAHRVREVLDCQPLPDSTSRS